MNRSSAKTPEAHRSKASMRTKATSKEDVSSVFSKVFTSFAKWTAAKSGSATTFMLAILVIVVWGVTGPLFHYNDTWQLVINTATTIVTFLMVFLIQNTQNRDTAAIQVKLDELILVQTGAKNVLLDLEELDQNALECIRKRYQELAKAEREREDQSADNSAESNALA
jgi:low affinity Fe/Cu permease